MRLRGSVVQLLLLTLAWVLPPGSGHGAMGGMHRVGGLHFDAGSDIDFRGSLAFVGSFDQQGQGGLHVVDISEPSNPVELSRFPCWGYQDDVAVWRDYVVLGMHDSGDAPGCSPVHKGGLRILDVSDPAHPTQISFLEIGGVGVYPRHQFLDTGLVVFSLGGTHTVTVVGDTGYVYSSPGGDPNRETQPSSSKDGMPTTIVDIRDPYHPQIVRTFTPPGSSGCHDMSIAGNRAYCAGSNVTQIWDITDPVHPVVIGRISSPLIHFHHSVVPSPDGKTLVITDEETLSQVCVSNGTSPIGAFWFYDISDERHPALRGFLGPIGQRSVRPLNGNLRTWCTAHNFNMVPGRDWMVGAAYTSGTMVIDFSDPSHPKAVGHIVPPGASTWSAYYHDGAIYTSDVNRGFDVLTMDGLP